MPTIIPWGLPRSVLHTGIGGVAIELTNETGVASVAGALVRPGTGADNSVILTGVSDTETIGVFLESGVPDGALAWVVIAGIADVMLKDTTLSTRGNWVGTSDTAGRADATGASPPAQPAHFQEVGHCIETKVAGSNVKARCVLHFN